MRRAVQRWLLPVIATVAVVYALTPAISTLFGSVETGANGRAAIEFRLPAVGGAMWSLREHRGKVVVVNFWATWCPPSRQEAPALVRIHEQFGSRNVEVVGISLDEDPRAAVPKFAKSIGIRYPVLIPDGSDIPAEAISGLPMTWLVDAQGRVAHKYSGVITETRLAGDIKQLLREDRRD